MLIWCWCFWESKPFCIAWLLEKLFFPALVAVLVYLFAVRQLKKKRTIDFAEKQLTEFYGPMVAARTEIENFTIFDRTLRAASQHVDIRKREAEQKRLMTDDYVRQTAEYAKVLELFFEGLNARFLVEGIDALVNMRALFARKIAFADPDTQPWYEYFYSFVEMWNVHRKNQAAQFISPAVAGTVGAMFDEELLQPFYRHLRERAAFYHSEIAGLRSKKKSAPPPPSANPLDLIEKVESNPFFRRHRQ